MNQRAISALLGVEPVSSLEPQLSLGGYKSVQPTTTEQTAVNSGAAENPATDVSFIGGEDTGSPDLAANSAAKSADSFQRNVLFWPGTRRAGWNLKYHGGEILSGAINLYLIFYGNWAANQGQDIAVITNFINSISDDSADSLGPTVHKWWNLAQQYTNSAGQRVASQVTYGKGVVMAENYTTSLADGSDGSNDDIFGLIKASLDGATLPYDPQGVYAVLTSADVRVGPTGKGFCAWYCAWHGYKSFQGRGVPYFFVGDPSLQCNTCGSGLARANGFPGAESMITSFAHELAECASNPNTPQFRGWWSRDMETTRGYEVGDLCNRVYRDDANNFLFSDSRGRFLFNMFGIKGYKYLVQGLPNLWSQRCTLQGASPS